MDQLNLDRDKAAEVFLSHLIIRAYTGAINISAALLEHGPPGRVPDAAMVAVHRWYSVQPMEIRALVDLIVEYTARSSVFSSLTVLDGKAGCPRVLDFPCCYSLSLEVFPDIDSMGDSEPMASIRINPVEPTGEELHDLFNILLSQQPQ